MPVSKSRSSSVSDSGGAGGASSDSLSTFSSQTLDHMASEILDLGQKLSASRKQIENLESSLRKERTKSKHTRKDVKNLDAKLFAQEEQAEHEEKEEDLKRKLTNTRQRVYYYQKQVRVKDQALQESQKSTRDFQLGEAKARSEVRRLELELDDLRAQIEEQENSPVIRTMDGGQYTDDVRKCCMELLSLNVGVWNIGRAILCMLDMVGLQAEPLPSVSLLSQMLVELKQVSAMQVAEAVTGAGPTTLHSDGTSKFGKKFGSFQIATPAQVFTVGVVDMKCGSAQHTLDKLKEVLSDVELACNDGGERLVAKNILKELKNTMSDQCIVEKKFNTLLQEYREHILPDVVTGWHSLSSEQQSSIVKMNNFFCGLHLIVGLADQSQACLSKWEDVHFEGQTFGATELPLIYDTSESRVFRMLRTTASAFHKRGNEQAGCMDDFAAFMKDAGIQIPLAELRGNRSYVSFFNGAGVYFLRDTLLHFLQDVHEETNLLLKAVKADLVVDALIAAARALGLLSKFVITPLWAVLEKRDISIFDMSSNYSELQESFRSWSTDTSPLLDGSAHPFASATVDLRDAVTSRLLEPENCDGVTQDVLQHLCTAYVTLLNRLLVDHLPGGKFHAPSDEL